MSLRELIKQALAENGYDGLFIPGDCACQFSDLEPGDRCLSSSCEPGYKHTHSDGVHWVISRKKDPVSDAEIEDSIND